MALSVLAYIKQQRTININLMNGTIWESGFHYLNMPEPLNPIVKCFQISHVSISTIPRLINSRAIGVEESKSYVPDVKQLCGWSSRDATSLVSLGP
jgi:hypothetical protein